MRVETMQPHYTLYLIAENEYRIPGDAADSEGVDGDFCALTYRIVVELVRCYMSVA